MSGMLHPVGPEPARTYWIRRGILLAVVLVLLVLVVVAVTNLTRSAVATAPPPVIAVPADTTSPTPAPSGTPSATPSVSGAPGATPSATAPSPSTTPTAPASAPAATASAAPSSAAPTPTASVTPRPTTTTVVGTPDCRPADLRVRITGDATPRAGADTRFRLSLVNTGDATCLTSVTDANFALTVVSGQDRIWSSRDCRRVLADFDAKLAAEATRTWAMTWDGDRSAPGESCAKGSGSLRPGTYWAVAQLKGVEPVRLRMVLS